MLSAPRRLRCNFTDLPLAVSDATPHLSWWASDTRPAELQSAYEIVAASTLQGLKAGRNDLWESGVVASGSCAWVEYGGKALSSNAHVWWKVRTYDSDGLPSPWSDVASFETGLFEACDWQILEHRFELGVVIPPGCSAQVIMPDGTEQLAQSGRHRFVMDFDSRPDDVPTLLNVAGIRADGG